MKKIARLFMEYLMALAFFMFAGMSLWLWLSNSATVQSQEGAPAAVQIAQQKNQAAQVALPKVYLNLLLFVEDIDPAKKEQIVKLLGDLAAKQFDGVEVPVAGIDEKFAYWIGEQARKKGLGVSAVGYLDGKADITSDDEKIRQAGVDLLKDMIINARALADGNGEKDKPIVLSGPICFPLKVFAPEGSKHEEWIYKRRNIARPIYQQMAKFAEQKLVLLAGEGVQRFEAEWLNTAKEWWQWVNQVGLESHLASGVMMDTCHEMAGGEGFSEYRDTISKVAAKKRLWNVHFSAVHRGNIDESWLLETLPRFVGPLADIGYGKPISIELNGREHAFTPVVSLEIFNPGGPLKDFLNLRGPKWSYSEALGVAVDSKQASVLAWKRGVQQR